MTLTRFRHYIDGRFEEGTETFESLDPSTGKPNSSSLTSLAQRTANNGAIEASAVWKAGNFYYLFTSWDNCCNGLSSTYNIRVGRSTRYVSVRRGWGGSLMAGVAVLRGRSWTRMALP